MRGGFLALFAARNDTRRYPLPATFTGMFVAILLAATLATGAQLEPVGRTIDAGNLPLTMTLTPERDRAVLVLSGYRSPGVQVVDLSAGNVAQTIPLNSAFIGAAFSPDGKTLYVSGGYDDVVHVYSWANKEATFVRDVNLRAGDKKGSSFPAGIATSSDGRFVYVAENVADDVAVIDAATFAVVTRIKTDRYPYEVAVSKNGDVFVSAWGANTVSVIRDNAEVKRIDVGRHPSALALNGDTLYVALASVDQIAIVDTKTMTRSGAIVDSVKREGTTPNALAFSRDGKQMYVAEAGNNAIAVFDLATKKRHGRIPTGWYPTDVIVDDNRLVVLNAKGRGTAPNPQGPNPGTKHEETYTLALVNGTVGIVELPVKNLASLTQKVASINHWQEAPRRAYPPFKHVIYIIKENRTYDQVLGDIKEGDGDASLLFFPRESTPNHHALAERFGLFDRFFTAGEVSQQGHFWSTAAYVTDYTEKTTHPLYAHKREDADEGDVDEPSEGYLWTRAAEKKKSVVIYGEMANPTEKGPVAGKPSVAPFLNPDYSPFDMNVSDQKRVDVWIRDFYSKPLPALQVLHLPSDHTWGGRANKPTPRAYMADNDLALARIVSAVSKSRYWRDTVIFVVEDDAQDGPDHVDSHRSVMYAISAFSKKGTHHRFTNTTDVVGSIEQILGLTPMSWYDSYARPLSDVFGTNADLTPYEPIMPTVDFHELNPPNTPAAKKSAALDFSKPDVADENEVNRILWSVVKGDDVPYPGGQRAPTLMWMFGQ